MSAVSFVYDVGVIKDDCFNCIQKSKYLETMIVNAEKILIREVV